MNAKNKEQDSKKLNNSNTLGIDGLSTHPNAPSKPTNPDLPIEFGRYRLLKVLGEGGMGAVYLAHDIELDRKVALKLPHFSGGKSKVQSERFRREARLAATLDHANICRIHDIGEQDGRLFLTMQYIEGKTLNDIIKAKGAIEPRTAVNLVKRIASAVQVAHAQGIIHRDLKPANIMIKKDRDFVIMDFGLARRVEQDDVQLTATGAVLGTPAYMAPEQLRGENNAVGPQSDVYSLGIILYELLTGQRPFQGTLPQIYAQVLSTDSVFPSSVKTGLDSALDEICRKATSANTNERYRTAEEFSKALGGYLAGQSQAPLDALASVPAIAAINAPFASYQPTIKKPKSDRTTYRKSIAIGAMVGLATLVFLGAFLFRRSNTQTIDEPTAKVESTPPGTTPQTSSANPDTLATNTSSNSVLIASTTEQLTSTSGVIVDGAPQVMQLSETPDGLRCSVPALTANGLTLYWAGLESTEKSRNIWTANRKSYEGYFENPKKLFAGNEPTVSSDGLELIFVDPINGLRLWKTNRSSTGDAFNRPSVISELGDEKLCAPFLTASDCVLYAERPLSEKGKFELVRSDRKERGAPWSKPTPVTIDSEVTDFGFGSVSNDERILFGCTPRTVSSCNTKNRLVMLTRSDTRSSFENPTEIDIAELPLECRFARYLPDSHELFFTGKLDTNPGAKIWVVRNFVPNTYIKKLKSDVVSNRMQNNLENPGNSLQLDSPSSLPNNQANGDNSSKPPVGFLSLFNGKDFEGWHGRALLDPRKWDETPQATKSKWNRELEDAWKVEDGAVTNNANGVYLTYDKEFGDVELLLEYMTSPKVDSGLLLRGTPQIQIWDCTDKEKFKHGADKGSGGLWNNQAGSTGKDPLVLADKPHGQWNKMRIVQVGARTSVWLNGMQVVDRAIMENHWAKDQPLIDKGVFQLQGTSSGTIRFRNIFAREIVAKDATSAFSPDLNQEPATSSQNPSQTTGKDQSSSQRDSTPQLSEISETPEGLASTCPAITSDGLTLFWAGAKAGDTSRSIWSANRKDHEALFEDSKKLFAGTEPTVSGDGLELVFVDPVKGSGLWSSTRSSIEAAFKRPVVISELTQERLSSPFLTNNDLTLYAERPTSEKGKSEIVRARRSKRGAPWTGLEVVQISSGSLNIHLGSVSNDEKLLFGYSRISFDGKNKNSLFVVTRSTATPGFEKPVAIDLPDRPLVSTFPRYSQSNRELLFSGTSDPARGARLWIVKDFDPTATSQFDQSSIQRNSTPQLSEISEMPDGLASSVPAISKDGLTLFWAGLQKGDSSRLIWTAKRKTTEHLFGDFQKLFPGNEPTVSSDGRYLVFVDPVKGSGLWQTAKLSADESFKRPAPIAEFDGEPLSSPFMTNDDLVLYAHRQASETGKFEIVRASRPKRGAPWSKLEVVPIGGSVEIYLGSVSNDEKLLFGYSSPDYQGKSKNDLFVLTRAASKLGFEKPTSLNIPDLPVTSTFPRYLEVSRELLFSSAALGKGSRLCIVRDFDPFQNIESSNPQ